MDVLVQFGYARFRCVDERFGSVIETETSDFGWEDEAYRIVDGVASDWRVRRGRRERLDQYSLARRVIVRCRRLRSLWKKEDDGDMRRRKRQRRQHRPP